MPRISVIMPTFNCERYVELAVESVLGQSYGDFELLLLDDASSDGTFAKLERYRDPRIRLFRNENNLGLIQSLNKGLQAATGEYIARMDGDDISLPDRFRLQIAHLEESPSVGVLGASVQLIDAQGDPMGIRDYQGSDTLLRWRLLFGNPLAHPAVIFRRSILGGDLYDPNALYCEDYDLWVRLAQRAQIHSLPEQLLKYRIHPGSVSQKKADLMAKGSFRIAIKARKKLIGWELGGRPETAEELLGIYRHFLARESPSLTDEKAIFSDLFQRIARNERWGAIPWALRRNYVFPLAGALGKIFLSKIGRLA